jgi:hypothetical protein
VEQELTPAQKLPWLPTTDPDYDAALDVCRNICTACVVEGIEQRSRLFMSTECDSVGEDFLKRMESSVEVAIQQELNDHTKELRTLDASLDFGEVKASITQTIMSVYRENFSAGMRAGVFAMQDLELGASESILVSRVSQSFSANISVNLASRLRSTVDFYNEDQIVVQQKVIIDNSSGLKALYDQIEDSVDSLGELWSIIEGKIIIIAGIILLVAVIGMAIYYTTAL